MRPACMAAGGWRRTSHVSARRGRPRTEVFLISFGRAPAACVVLRNANDRNGTKVYTEVHTHTRTHGYQLGATATYAKKERGSLATVLGSSNRGPSLLQQRKHRDAMFVLSRPSGPAMHLSTLILLPLLLRLVFWIPRVPGPIQRAAFGVRAEVPAIAPELAEQAVAEGNGPLLRGQLRTKTFGHGRGDKPGRATAACDLWVCLRERHGVRSERSLGESIGSKSTDSAPASLLLGLDTAKNLLPRDVEADERRFLFALRLAHRILSHAALNVRRSCPATDVNDASFLLVEEGKKRVAHALGAHEIDVKDDVGAHPVREPGSSVVDDAIERFGGEGLGCGCHRFVLSDVHDH
mmetsp:Transcript_30246/g.56499  ORF Transcript_30246/g.56499 Transcript_30246/m.56499 type:complete len:351 (+) Transcript_30246:47-1099(+)